MHKPDRQRFKRPQGRYMKYFLRIAQTYRGGRRDGQVTIDKHRLWEAPTLEGREIVYYVPRSHSGNTTVLGLNQVTQQLERCSPELYSGYYWSEEKVYIPLLHQFPDAELSWRRSVGSQRDARWNRKQAASKYHKRREDSRRDLGERVSALHR
jgi:hypothetical protein